MRTHIHVIPIHRALEDGLHLLCGVLGCQHSPRASIRMTLRLLFAIEIVGPQLRNEPWIGGEKYAIAQNCSI